MPINKPRNAPQNDQLLALVVEADGNQEPAIRGHIKAVDATRMPCK